MTGNASATAEAGVEWVRKLVADLRIPSLGHYGLKREHTAELVEKASQASSMKANPITLTPDELAGNPGTRALSLPLTGCPARRSRDRLRDAAHQPGQPAAHERHRLRDEPVRAGLDRAVERFADHPNRSTQTPAAH